MGAEVLWWVITCAAALVTLWPSLSDHWLWDDEGLATSGALMNDASGLLRVWTGRGTLDYFPLTSTSFWLERRLFDGAWGHRVDNLVLHAANACLVGSVALRARVPEGRAAGLLFAVHPMIVSSAAWVSERKNTLSLFFALLALLAALPRDRAFPTRRGLGAVVGLFTLALLAKTQVVGLPLVIAALWWLRGTPPREGWASLGAMTVIAVGLGLLTISFQHSPPHLASVSALERLVRAADAVRFQLVHVLWPSPLVMIHERGAVGAGLAGGLTLALIALAAGALMALGAESRERTRHWARPALAILVSYLALLAPTLGLLDMAFMRFAFVAEHFAYAALPVALAAIVLALARLPRPAFFGALGAGVIVLGVVSHGYAASYASREALWRHNVRVVPSAAAAHGNLALELQAEHPERAIEEAREGVRLDPDDGELHAFLGAVLLQQLSLDEARTELERAIALEPGLARAHNNLASVLVLQGELEGGIEHLRTALGIEPDYALGHMNLARLLAARGELEDAHEEQARAIALDPAMREVPLVPDAPSP
ncbi:MAG: tetratricopeptide repeat protein [Sandaracinaceae bacterium]|nr:tetratricopeptide repeat protein [Sandaracinaceae bacterium]